ncbi:MAG: hypothetical protein KAT43_00940 [Nanoarchaeota archaeon]|nr:hypothetical protein [Nanoarchaeota archaeon]
MKKIMFALLVIAMFLATTIGATAAYNSVDAAVGASLAMGERKEVQVGATVYEVSLIGVYERSAKFKVNGEVTNLIEVGQWDFLADLSEIGLIDAAGDKVEFYIDAVPRVPSLSYTGAYAQAMKEGSSRTYAWMGREYDIVVKSLDRGGAKVSVNGEIILMRNAKEAESYGDTRYRSHYRLNDQAMLYMGMIFIYNNELYCTMHLGEIIEERVAIPEPIEPEQPAQELTYDKCVSNYFENANYHERVDRNYPLAKSLREEGLRICGERFGRPVPVPPGPMRSDYDRCFEEHMVSEDVFISMSPEDQAEIKQKVSRECDRFVEVVEVHPDYERCIEELEEFKQMLVEKYNRVELAIPEELMRQYEEKGDKCRVLSGEWRRTRPMPVEVEERPDIEYPEEEAVVAKHIRPIIEPMPWPEPMPVEFRRECSGCQWEDSCLPIGTRLVKENGEQRPLFCDVSRQLKPQRQLREQCQNNYECVSNSCHDGMCQSIGEKIEGIERELREQRGMMERILGFFGRIFGRG